ncbi:membrane protein [Streptomyces sp. XY431]|nr:membrane protein [Streptomyces sp. XY431]
MRLVSGPEGVSFLLLLLCSVLKRTTSFNGVPVMGMVHGILFILYVVFWIMAWQSQKWDVKRGAVLFVLSVLPGGGFVAERMLAKEERAGAAAAVPAAA